MKFLVQHKFHFSVNHTHFRLTNTTGTNFYPLCNLHHCDDHRIPLNIKKMLTWFISAQWKTIWRNAGHASGRYFTATDSSITGWFWSIALTSGLLYLCQLPHCQTIQTSTGRWTHSLSGDSSVAFMFTAELKTCLLKLLSTIDTRRAT